MKLEKREIMLNEADSVKDICYMEKTLLNEYLHALSSVQTKEEAQELMRCMQEVQEDLLLLKDMIQE